MHSSNFVQYIIALTAFHQILSNQISTKLKTECKSGESIHEVSVMFPESSSVPVLVPICKVHRSNVIDKCSEREIKEAGKNPLKLPLCLMKIDERITYRDRDSSNDDEPSRPSEDFQESCKVNNKTQSTARAGLWNQKSAKLQLQCQEIECAWDCLDFQKIVTAESGQTINISSETIYEQKYGSGKYNDSFLTKFDISRIVNGEQYEIQARFCRDCSIAPPAPWGGCFYETTVIVIGSGCPTGWTGDGDICYKDMGVNAIQTAAKSMCSSEDSSATLPIFKDHGEWTDFLDFLAASGIPRNRKVWMAGDDRAVEGTFDFTEATSGLDCGFPYIPWGSSDPNNFRGREHCILRRRRIAWDHGCNNRQTRVVCQIRASKFCDACETTTTTVSP